MQFLGRDCLRSCPGWPQRLQHPAEDSVLGRHEDHRDHVAAEESRYKELENIGHNTVGGVKSQFQRDKDKNLRTKCINCGGARHGSGGPEDRAKHCPAFGKTCTKCQRKNHLASVCRSQTKLVAGVQVQEDKQALSVPPSPSLVSRATTPSPLWSPPSPSWPAWWQA